MRLLFIHERYGAWGGAEANIFVTGAEMRHRGHEIGLLHGARTGVQEGAWDRLFERSYPQERGFAARSLLRAVQDFRPEILYIHKTPDLDILTGAIGSKLPTVRMVHDHDVYCMRSSKYNVFTRRICNRPFSFRCLIPCGGFIGRSRGSKWPLRWVSYRAKKRELGLNRCLHRMIVATQYMAGELIRNKFDPARVVVIPPVTHAGGCAGTSSFCPRNRLMFVGQIIRGKGLDVLLESLARVDVPFEFLIFGDGSHRPYCERLSQKLGIANRVHFKGFVAHEELEAYYAHATALLVSSVWPEPFGAVGLEGFRHGVPAVAFDAGGIREWLSDGVNGFLVPWMDRDTYAARVRQLLEDKQLAKRLGENGRRMSLDSHRPDRYAAALESSFEELLEETREIARL